MVQKRQKTRGKLQEVFVFLCSSLSRDEIEHIYTQSLYLHSRTSLAYQLDSTRKYLSMYWLKAVAAFSWSSGAGAYSMTSLLTHTVAHSTKPASRPKTNNQSIKKFFKSCGQLSKICQKLGVILKMVWKLNLSKNFNDQKCAPQMIFFNETFF